jgi:hypothetical protein
MLKKIIKHLVLINLCLLTMIFVIVGFLIWISPENWKFLLAHTTGMVVIIALISYIKWLLPKYYIIYLNKYTTYAYISSAFGCSAMLLGYILYLIVHLSPYVNATTSVIFDYSTLLSSIFSNYFLIKAIIYHKKNIIEGA